MSKTTLAFSFALLSQWAFADDGAPATWLERMSHSHREISYSGVVTYQIGDDISSFRITHSIIDGKEYELFEPLDSDSGEMIRTGHSLQCIHAADQLIRSELDASLSVEGSLEQIYELTMGEEGRVGGRESVTVELMPRDVYRLHYRLALDRATALPLRSEILDQGGHVIERFQFATLELGEDTVAPEKVAGALEIKHTLPLPLAESEMVLRRHPWRPHWVPAGFVLAQSDEEGRGSALSYTDGLSMFSVFVEPVAEGASAPQAGSMQHGATVAYTHPFEDRAAAVIVVGEIPLLTAQQVAQSVRWIE